MRERSAAKSMARAATPPPPAATPSQSMPLDLMIPATAERIAVSTPDADASPTMPDLEMPHLPGLGFATEPPPPPPSPRLAEIAAAIARGSMDVFLSPIVALQTHQVSHYEVTVRLRSSKGGYLDGAEQELQLASSDVLALFDTERLKCAAELAGRLDAHNKPGSLLSPVNGPSLTNGEFLDTFARAYEERDRISNQLVLTFAQADVELFSASAWQALGNMHAFGFRFAVAQIDHVAMDFAGLAKRGFSFLRLDANALINGLPGRDRFFGSAELCQLLAGAGMTLVADAIEDEAIRARVFGFGVLFGQGRLFGGARQVKLDTLPPGSSAAA
jgi:cyclic-di-GMP phosphodiesterase TipF (flagellum assembly factor)